jgi:hypothetical protein
VNALLLLAAADESEFRSRRDVLRDTPLTPTRRGRRRS